MTDENNAFSEFGARSSKFDELLKKYQTIDENGVVAPKPETKPEPEKVEEEAPVMPEITEEEPTESAVEEPEAEIEAEEEESVTEEEAIVLPEPEAEEDPEEYNEEQPAFQEIAEEIEAPVQEEGFSMDFASVEPEEEAEPDFSYDLDMFGTGSAKSEKVIDIDSFDDSWLDSAFDDSLFYNAGAIVEQVEEDIQPEVTVEAEYAEESQPEPEDIPAHFIDDVVPDTDKAVIAGGYIAPSDFSDFSFDPESGMAFDDDEFQAQPDTLPQAEKKKTEKIKKKAAKEKKESGKNEMTCVTGFSKDYKASEGKGCKKEGFFSRNLVVKKDDSTAEKARKIIMIICVIAFLASALYLINDYVIEPYKNSKQLNELESLISDSDKPADKLTLEQQYPGVKFPEGMLEKYAPLYAKNQDFVGWINIEGLDISLPIVQGNNNEEYLKKNFEGKKNKYGSIFMNCSNKVDRLDYNTTLFGHYMYDSKMFGNLMQYKSAAGYKKAPVIEFNTLFADYKWKVFAVFITNGTQEGDDGYLFNYIFTELSSEKAVESFMGEIKQRSIYYPPVDIKASDKILTLSTCTYEFDEARLVIMARMLRPGESEQVDTSKIGYNSNPRYPAAYYEEKELDNPYASAYRWYPS